MDGLAAALAAEGLGEYVALLEGATPRLRVANEEGQRPLLECLRDVGVTKMGQRQKISKIVRLLLEQDAPAARLENPTPPPPAPASEDCGFWASMIDANADATSAGDLGAVQLDAEQYATPVRVLPRAPPNSRRGFEPLTTVDAPVNVVKRSAVYPDTASGCGEQDDGARLGEQLSVYRERGNVAFKRHEYDGATRWYEKVLAVKADDGAGGLNLDHAAAMSNLAACALAREPADPTGAMLRLKPLLAALPRHVKGRLRAGKCCVMLGRLQEAVTHYEVALREEKPQLPASGLQLRYAPPVTGSGGEADPERRRLTGPDGKTALSENAQQASDGQQHATRLLSKSQQARSLAAVGRVDEALYLARAVCRACTHSTIGWVAVVRILEGCGRLWHAQQEAEEAVQDRGGRFADDEELNVRSELATAPVPTPLLALRRTARGTVHAGGARKSTGKTRQGHGCRGSAGCACACSAGR